MIMDFNRNAVTGRFLIITANGWVYKKVCLDEL